MFLRAFSTQVCLCAVNQLDGWVIIRYHATIRSVECMYFKYPMHFLMNLTHSNTVVTSKDDVNIEVLTQWGRVMHIFVSKIIIIGSDDGLAPDRRQAIIWNNAGKLLVGPVETNFSEILIEIHISSFNKMQLNLSSAKYRLFCLSLKELI